MLMARSLPVEDLHWADPTTLDVLHGLAGPGALAPLFIAATTMIAELSARHVLPREVVNNVAARTGGVPLFVEEVTRLLLERGDKGGIHAIPPSLQQSLTARLD